MKQPIDPHAIASFTRARRPLTLQAAMCEAERCLLCEDAPCSSGCPAGTDPGRFIRQIRFRNFKGAARTIRANNVLGATCAHVCPTAKLCEAKCTAKGLAHPIDISGLQQFAIEYGRQHGLEDPEPAARLGTRVAVVGAGPAGLSCAAELARHGHSVTVYEADPVPGGVPRWNIPEFRLPATEIEADLAQISSLGVEIRCSSPVDTPERAQDLLHRNDAVVVASGLNEAFSLPLCAGAPNAVDYITWLRRAKTGREAMQAEVRNRRVAVIGGGSVALDAAVTSCALGAARVFLISLEQLSELPADAEEIELGRLVHVVFRAGSMITGVDRGADGSIVVLRGSEIEWVEPDRFVPDNARLVPNTEFALSVDFVVLAIGTRPVFASLFGELPTWDKGCFRPCGEDRPWAQAGKLFATGDVVNRGSMVVGAVGEGKKTAAAVHAYLQGGAR